jgi:hypothetical protein
VDFDGDGHLDLVSGSYDPGELYLFRGEGQGKFAAREVINDKGGQPILKVPNQMHRVESFGSWMALVDWDADGDLDILVGTYDGMMFLRINEGTRQQPAYATTNTWVQLGEEKLRIPGDGHANPVIIDWDGDGRSDIITGSAAGGVYWYRNIGQPGQPRFETLETLIAKHEGVGYEELLEADAQPKPGIRSQIAVTDYDGDGKLDVLVGDFCTYLHLKKDLTAAQRREFEKLRKQQEEAGKRLGEIFTRVHERFKESMKGVPEAQWHAPQYTKKWQDTYLEMKDSAPYKAAREEQERLARLVHKFVERTKASDFIAGSPATPHGYVWLFRHK